MLILKICINFIEPKQKENTCFCDKFSDRFLMEPKDKKIKNQVKQIKVVSRLSFAGRATKIKPSGKVYTRKGKKSLPGTLITLPLPNLYTLHHS